jgi:hypothetical protein
MLKETGGMTKEDRKWMMRGRSGDGMATYKSS